MHLAKWSGIIFSSEYVSLSIRACSYALLQSHVYSGSLEIVIVCVASYQRHLIVGTCCGAAHCAPTTTRTVNFKPNFIELFRTGLFLLVPRPDLALKAR